MAENDTGEPAIGHLRSHARFPVLLEMLELDWRIHDANSRSRLLTLLEQEEAAQTRELMAMAWELLAGEPFVRPVVMAEARRLRLVKGEG